ncbi:MAG: IS630 family transposase [Gammaproteobacteria bacterium]
MDTKIDARKLSLEALEEKRRLAHQLRKRGMTRAEIGEIVGVHADTVGKWLKLRSNELGYETPGRKVGSGTRLSQGQSERIRKLVIDKTPDQLKMPYALWTRESVRELIRSQCGIEMPVRTVGDYLKRWGMTPQKPQKRAYEQRAPEVQAWLEDEYPAIQERAKREDAEIYWGDETGIRNDCQHERGYALKGKTPTIRLNAKRESINMISALTNQGKVRFRFFEGTMNADILIDFMMRLLKDAKRKVYLILDNLRVHHAKPVKEWLEDHKQMIEVFYLPAYSPELNPDEYLNCDLKAGVHSGTPARNKDQLKQKASKHMRMLQRKPSRVRKYFQHQRIRYAA